MLRAALLLVISAIEVCAQAHPDFSGKWRQVNERCLPPPKNKAYNYQAAIEQKGNLLIVDMTTLGSSAHGELHLTYEIGGKETVYIGLDHDEFHARAHWESDSLVFDIQEHERGKVNETIETWTLIEDGHSLKRVRNEKESGDLHLRTYVLAKR